MAHARRECVDPREGSEIDFAGVAIAEVVLARERGHGCAQRAGSRLLGDAEPVVSTGHAAFQQRAVAPGDPVCGHGVEHFVGDHAAVDGIGQGVEPFHTMCEMRH